MTDGGADLFDEIRAAVASAPDRRVPTLRAVRREVSRRLKPLEPPTVLTLADRLLESGDVPRWFAFELVHHHRPTLRSLDARALSRLGTGMADWTDVDPFACLLSGVAWREGQISDATVHGWARSPDRWWRRAALVSTVPLNTAARGGQGDTERTLAVCDRLRADRDDMVVKAMSWALRELMPHDADALRAYVDRHESELAARVVREVRNKLDTGLKNPRRRGG